MKRTLAATCGIALTMCLGLAAGFANVLPDNGGQSTSPTDATQLRMRPGGRGHQLIVPYYTAQNGNVTFLNIVNTDGVNGKAVKVRFRSGFNADHIGDFQLYLSPGDVWVVTISKGPDGKALLTTNDRSCTLPYNVGAGAGTPLVTARLPATLPQETIHSYTREGFVEIITLADIPPNMPNPEGSASANANPLFTAIKHVAGVAPCTAAVMNQLVTDPQTTAGAYALGFRSPSASLLANWIILDIPRSAAASGEAMAIVAARPDNTPGRGNIVFFPQTGSLAATPNLHTADVSLRTAAGTAFGEVQNGAGAPYAGGATPIITASQFDLPDLSTPYLLTATYPPNPNSPVLQAQDISWSLATASILNEFLTNPALGAATDWVVSQPMRRYHAVLDYRPAASAAPFARAFNASAFYNSASTNAQLCILMRGVSYYDREEGLVSTAPPFNIPEQPLPVVLPLCGVTSVMSFNASAPASVLGAQVGRAEFNTGASTPDGWLEASFPGGFGLGIPMLGKAFMRASNANAGPGISANFGLSFEHRYQPTRP